MLRQGRIVYELGTHAAHPDVEHQGDSRPDRGHPSVERRPECGRSGLGLRARNRQDRLSGRRDLSTSRHADRCEPRCGQSRDYDAAIHRNKVSAQNKTTPSLHAVLKMLTSRKIDHRGTFSYISPNTDPLGRAIERTTGKTFATLVSELLWKPMGAEHRANIISPWCSGGFKHDSPRLRTGRRPFWSVTGGGEPATSSRKAGSTNFATTGTGTPGRGVHDSKNMSYCAGWYPVHDDPKHLFAMGVHGQNLVRR